MSPALSFLESRLFTSVVGNAPRISGPCVVLVSCTATLAADEIRLACRSNVCASDNDAARRMNKQQSTTRFIEHASLLHDRLSDDMGTSSSSSFAKKKPAF